MSCQRTARWRYRSFAISRRRPEPVRSRRRPTTSSFLYLLFDCAAEFKSETILFHDARTTELALEGVTFRKVTEPDRERIFPHKLEGVGDWLLEAQGEIVATGGVYTHYNPPYGDISMEVNEPFRRRGFGSYLVQELKRTSYEMGKIPAARCNLSNVASRATLQKAGFLPCARILHGVLSS